ncbi:MAG: DNA/RNA nuclease SfsA [Cyanobacteria bacterium WB6_1B_304]|nr:DNA/RNA nuclease SfsA [Cyanobacteria bacterium WB6_1B_304]
MSPLIYSYPPLLQGYLIKRYQRFLADIQLESGEVITAHCPNTGPMTGVCEVGSRVQVSHHQNPKRKLAYTWEMIEVKQGDNDCPVWVGINTALPNRVVQLAIQHQLIPELGTIIQIQWEVAYGQDGKSRIDLLLTGEPGERPIYLEIKNTTWSQGDLALFPDTVTTRGQKHLRELMMLPPDCRAVMLYFINRGDCRRFAPGDTADPTYGMLLRNAMAQGVEVLPCRFFISPLGISYLGLADIAFS